MSDTSPTTNSMTVSRLSKYNIIEKYNCCLVIHWNTLPHKARSVNGTCWWYGTV